MNNLTISIFGNKIFLEIINELKLFPGSKVNFLDNLSLCTNNEIFRYSGIADIFNSISYF